MIIDFHTHTFPEKIAKGAIEKLEDSCKWKAVGDGTQADLINQMDISGVDISVVAPVATSKTQVSGINRKLIKTNRIMTLGAMHPEFSDFEAELDFLKQNSVHGIKLHPDYQGFRVDDKKMFGLYEALLNRDMFVLFHAGVDIGLPPPYGGTPKMIKVVAKEFPKLKIIAAHYGGYNMWEDVLEHLVGLSNVWLDTSLCSRGLKDELFYEILNKHGSDKILLATDWPWTGSKEAIQWLKSKNLKQNQLDLILGENAKLLLKL